MWGTQRCSMTHMKKRAWLAWPAILGTCILMSGCHHVPTIWRAELPSPDGSWVAIAHTEQNGGFGSASIETSVDLQRVDGSINSGRPVNVLLFECDGPAPHAYVLDNANAGGTIHLAMRWMSPSNLEATYDGRAQVDFQVAKIGGVQISLRDTSKELPTSGS